MRPTRSQQLAALLLCWIAPSMQTAAPPSSSRAVCQLASNQPVCNWLQVAERSLGPSHMSAATPLQPLWRQPCPSANATLTLENHDGIYAANMARNARQLGRILADLLAWTNSSRLNAAIRRTFRSVPLPGLPRITSAAAPQRWPSAQLALTLDEGLGRLAIYMQLFRLHMHSINERAVLVKTQRAEALLQSLLRHMHCFIGLRIPGQLAWPSAELTVAKVVPRLWRSAGGSVQLLANLRNFVASKEAARFVQHLLQLMASGGS